MRIDRTLEMQLAPELFDIFLPLLREGVEVEVEVGCTITQLLTEQFGIASSYIRGRITTLFLNCKAVDDPKNAFVENGSVLALSGAMPGLVGATMRSGGYYAAMRSSISFKNDQVPLARRGRIKVKLFNLLLEELGRRILCRGVLISGSRLKQFLSEQPENLRPRSCRMDGQAFQGDFTGRVKALFDDEDMVSIKVQFGD